MKDVGKEVSHLISAEVLKNRTFAVNVTVDPRKLVLTAQKEWEEVRVLETEQCLLQPSVLCYLFSLKDSPPC